MRTHRAIAFLLFLFLLVAGAPAAQAKGSHGSHRRSHAGSYRAASPRTHRASTRRAAVGVARNSHGRIERSEAAKRAFMRQTGYPHGRPGYVIDHVRPLACGGADAPSNMQWQTKAEARVKDRVERRGC